jgi:response regulator NasT
MEAVPSTPRILIIDNNPERANSLIQILEASRYKVAVPVRLQEGLAEQVAQIKPDIILIGVDFPGQAILNWVAALHESYPCPTVMFSRDERSETIQAATRAGVSAYAVGKLTGARVKTIIEAAVARFYEFRALQQELEKTKTNLAERKIIERAKELVAQQRGCTESQAYQILRKMAMNRRKRLAEISQDVLSVAEVLTNKL